MRLIYSILLVVFGCVAGAYGAILLKKGADRLKFRLGALIKNRHLIFGVLLYGAGTVAYILALRGGELSLLYPLVSTTYVWIAVFSQKLLGEKMNKYKWIGIIFILLGVSLIGFGTKLVK